MRFPPESILDETLRVFREYLGLEEPYTDKTFLALIEQILVLESALGEERVLQALRE